LLNLRQFVKSVVVAGCFFHKLTAVFQKPFLNCTSKVTVVVASEIGVYRDQPAVNSCNISGWLRSIAVFGWQTSLSCARPVADGWPLMWVNRPL